MKDEPRYPEVSIDVPADQADDAVAALFELGATGVATRRRDAGPGHDRRADDARREFRQSNDGGSGSAGARSGVVAARVEIVGDGWRDEWKKHFAPFRLTERITIRPPWQAYEARAPSPAGDFPGSSEIVLELEPGRAFGTGLHPTTAIVARVLEGIAPRLRGCEFLDVGTGSGILALVAIALGAARARAIDVDPDTVPVAIENARRNGYEDRIEASMTPIGAVKKPSTSSWRTSKPACSSSCS